MNWQTEIKLQIIYCKIMKIKLQIIYYKIMIKWNKIRGRELNDN